MSRENEEVRDLILLAMLPQVVFEGWTQAALQAGVDALGDHPELGPKAGERAFPGGMVDLAGHFSNWTDRVMVAEMAKMDMDAMKISERVAAGVRLRLQALAPHREAVRRLLAFLALPHHAPTALASGYRTVSEIWFAAGDESADFNFYTKRALLTPVLVSTVLFWLSDDGDEEGEFPETWAFLDRSIANVLKFPPFKAKLMDRFSRLPSPAGLCRRFASAAQARRT